MGMKRWGISMVIVLALATTGQAQEYFVPDTICEVDTNAVMKKVKGQSWGVSNRLYTGYRRGWTVLDQLDVMYSKEKWDVAGTVTASDVSRSDRQITDRSSGLGKGWAQNSKVLSEGRQENLSALFTANYRLDNHHSMGVKYSLDRVPDHHSTSFVISNVQTADTTFETSLLGGLPFEQSTRQGLDFYYNGKAGEWKMTLDAGALWKKERRVTEIIGDIKDAGGLRDEEFNALNRINGQLYAVGLLLSHPLWGGNLAFGGEYAYGNYRNRYQNRQGVLENANVRIGENTAAAFVDYNHDFGKLKAKAGLRYEHVESRYYDGGERRTEYDRRYDHVFPSASLAWPIGKIEMQADYAMGIVYPSYSQLCAVTVYNNRYSYTEGNPLLRPSLRHQASLKATYRWLYFNTEFLHIRDGIMGSSHSYSVETPYVIVGAPVNAPARDQLSATLVASPVIGIWSPRFSLRCSKQWFSLATPKGRMKLNKPISTLNWANNLELPFGFRLNVEAMVNTDGHSMNYFFKKPRWYTNAGLGKSFLKRSVDVQLQVTDLFNSNDPDVAIYYSNIRSTVDDNNSRRTFHLNLRYSFNAVRSKYQGKGAGGVQKRRM